MRRTWVGSNFFTCLLLRFLYVQPMRIDYSILEDFWQRRNQAVPPRAIAMTKTA